MRKLKREYLMIAIFMIMIGTAYFWWMVFGKYVDSENHENRALAARPEFSWETLNDYPSMVEDCIDDHLPFRNQLVFWNSAIDYYVFRSSSSAKVLVGQEDWLFYRSTSDGDPIANYMGRGLLTQEKLELIADNMLAVRDNLAEDGIEFVIFIAPNKERIYSDKMPIGFGEPAEEYKIKQVVEYLQEHTDLRVVYPVEEILTAKEALGDEIPLYHKTDTHWNQLGAYIGASVLLKELGVFMPSYDSSEVSIDITAETEWDLANMLQLPELVDKQVQASVSGYDKHDYVCDEWDYGGFLRYHAEGADPRKIMIRRDSFTTAMAEVIASQFEESAMVHSNGFSYNLIEEESPDIFVLEMVERYAAENMMDFSME